MNDVEKTPEISPEGVPPVEETPQTPAVATPLLPAVRGVPTLPQLLVALSILAGVFFSSYIPGIGIQKKEEIPAVAVPANTAQTIKVETPEPTLHAHSAFVWDVKNQRALFNKNADAQLPLASLTKLMTALVAYETLGSDAIVPITLEAIQTEGESGLADGDTFLESHLSNYMLITSSNDAAYALALAAGNAISSTSDPYNAFIEQMNLRAEELGLSQTYFTNATGLDENESSSGSYGSARDIAFLMEYLITEQPEILNMTTEPQVKISAESGIELSATNTNQLAGVMAGLLGSKTGYTTLAGGNLAVAFDAGLNHPVIIAVLGSTRDGRFSDVEHLQAEARATLGEEK